MTTPLTGYVRTQLLAINPRDILAIMKIERASFDLCWSAQNFRSCLSQHYCRHRAIVVDEVPVGYLIYEVCEGHLNVLNLAVHPDWRRQGLATVAVQYLIKRLKIHNRPGIAAVTRETNLGVQLFFKDLGFKCIKVLRSHYPDNREDGYLLCYGDIDVNEGSYSNILCKG